MNNMKRGLFKDKNVVAWALMFSTLAIHVFDETIANFLPFYNQLVYDLKARLGFFPMPTFAFEIWLVGLIVAIVIGFCLIPLVYRGGRFIRILTTALGILMVANALGHILGSVYLGRLIPGFWSSPFLLLTAVFVVFRGFRGEWGNR